MMQGVEKSAFPERNRRTVEDFTSRLEVLPYDSDAAAHYGEIRADLERKGTTFGGAVIWSITFVFMRKIAGTGPSA